MRNRLLIIALGVCFFGLALDINAKPLVLSSIKPLTLIVHEIGGDVVDVGTLLPATASHHDYPMKMSDVNRLQTADIVVWVGPELESFLQKPIGNLSATKVISAYTLTGIHWPVRGYRTVKEDKDEGRQGDPHLWLDPWNAIILAKAVAEKLGEVDPENMSLYLANFHQFSAKTVVLDTKLKDQLKPLSQIGFAVYHEGFAHFVSHYGLHQLDYVTFTPEQKPGAKHLNQLREKLAKEGRCLFLEPYNDMQSARDLAQELHLKLGTLDAIGGQEVVSYAQLLEQMAGAFSACLADGRTQ